MHVIVAGTAGCAAEIDTKTHLYFWPVAVLQTKCVHRSLYNSAEYAPPAYKSTRVAACKASEVDCNQLAATRELQVPNYYCHWTCYLQAAITVLQLALEPADLNVICCTGRDRSSFCPVTNKLNDSLLL